MRQTILLALSDIKLSHSLSSALLLHPKYKIVHICDSCQEAKEFILKQSPHIALLDQSIKDTCGIKLAKNLRDLGARTKLAILSSSNSKELMRTALEYGVLGYFSHKKMHKLIISCLDKISANRYFIDQDLFINRPAMKSA